MVSFVVVETLNDKKAAVWEFRGHSEPSTPGELHPRFTRTIKIPLRDHLNGTVLLTNFRFTVLMSRMSLHDHEQMSHEFANSPDCPVCARFHQLEQMAADRRMAICHRASVSDLLLRSKQSDGSLKWTVRSSTASLNRSPTASTRLKRTGSIGVGEPSSLERTESICSLDQSLISPDSPAESGPESPLRTTGILSTASSLFQRTPSGMLQVFQRAGSIVQANVKMKNKKALGSQSSGKDIAVDGMVARHKQKFSKVLHVVTLYSKCNRALTVSEMLSGFQWTK
jgi:hypothetical protein